MNRAPRPHRVFAVGHTPSANTNSGQLLCSLEIRERDAGFTRSTRARWSASSSSRRASSCLRSNSLITTRHHVFRARTNAASMMSLSTARSPKACGMTLGSPPLFAKQSLDGIRGRLRRADAHSVAANARCRRRSRRGNVRWRWAARARNVDELLFGPPHHRRACRLVGGKRVAFCFAPALGRDPSIRDCAPCAQDTSHATLSQTLPQPHESVPVPCR